MTNYPFSAFGDSGLGLVFDAVQEQMERVLRNSGLPAGLRSLPHGNFPPVNVGVSDDAVVVVTFVPGLEPEALNVSIEKGLLTISGERKVQDLPEGARYYARERTQGAFTRVVELPADIDPDKVQARYVDGCLLITVGKKESSKPRQITVQ